MTNVDIMDSSERKSLIALPIIFLFAGVITFAGSQNGYT